MNKPVTVFVTRAKKRVIPITPERRARIKELLGGEDTVERYRKRIRNPQTAIRAFCIACTGGSVKDVAECTAPKCALYPFRMGKNPFRKRHGEEGAEAAEEADDLAEEGEVGDDVDVEPQEEQST